MLAGQLLDVVVQGLEGLPLPFPAYGFIFVNLGEEQQKFGVVQTKLEEHLHVLNLAVVIRPLLGAHLGFRPLLQLLYGFKPHIKKIVHVC